MTGEILRAFDRGFVVSQLFPSSVLSVMSLGIYLAGKDWEQVWASLTLTAQAATIAVLALSTIVTSVAFILYLVQTPIVKIFVGQCKSSFGYVAVGLALLSAPLFCCVQSRIYLVSLSLAVLAGLIYEGHERWQKAEQDRFAAKIESVKGGPREDLRVAQMRFARDFSPEGPCLPTRLGNIVNAYERHPSRAYNMDAFTFWYRLIGVIPEEYQQGMGYAEASFLAVLNLAVVSYIVSAEFFAMGILAGDPSWLVAAAVGCGVGWAAYCYSCDLAKTFGEYFRSAFDLYRLDLLRQLGVTTERGNVITLADERRFWSTLKNITWLSNPDALAESDLKFRLDREGPSTQAGPKP